MRGRAAPVRGRLAVLAALAAIGCGKQQPETTLVVTLASRPGVTLSGITVFAVHVEADGVEHDLTVPDRHLMPPISIPPERTFALVIPPGHYALASLGVRAVGSKGKTLATGRNDRIWLAGGGRIPVLIELEEGGGEDIMLMSFKP